MRKLTTDDIERIAQRRPAGFADEIRAAAVQRDDGNIWLEDDAFARLVHGNDIEARAQEVKRRFALCKECESVTESGHGCVMFRACCFGEWRASLENHCPKGVW